MKKISPLLYLLFTIYLCSPTLAQNTILYDTLKEGMGIWPLSLGSTGTSFASGAYSIFYNPAGLAKSGFEYRQENLDYKQIVYDEYSNNLVYLGPFGIGRWFRKDISGNQAEITAYGYGRQGRNGVDWGLTFKNIKSIQDGNTTNGWSTDFGIISHITPQLNLGFLVQDIFKKDVAVPASLRTGLTLANEERSFVFSVEWTYAKNDSNAQFPAHYGIQYDLADGLTGL